MDQNSSPELTALVEGDFDAAVLERLLRRAGFPLHRIRIVAAGGKAQIRKALAKLPDGQGERVIAVVDADELNVPDARQHAREELGNPEVAVFCAVPTIESWLLADPGAVREVLQSEFAREVVDRFPLPEEIPHAYHRVSSFFKVPSDALRLIDVMNMSEAAARSPSLHSFLEGLGEILGHDAAPVREAYSRSLGRDIFSNLLAEVAPRHSVVYQTADGDTITAEEMIRHVREGTELGRQYSSDILRISRDFLARKAQRAVKA